MTAKVENHCATLRTKSISVNRDERACVNCIWFEQYYREGRSNVRCYVPVCSGYCLLHEQSKRPMTQPCKQFETSKI